MSRSRQNEPDEGMVDGKNFRGMVLKADLEQRHKEGREELRRRFPGRQEKIS